MATGTTSHGISGSTDSTTEIGPAIGGTGTSTSGLVVLRDELGILSVMRCLDAELTLDRGFQYAYPAESAAMAGLSDPRIAAPISYVVDAAGQIVAIVCRHITGIRLSRLLSGLPRGLDVQTAASVVKDVLAALRTLHERGVAHRAPDPDHVIVEPNGACVLIDVGLVARATAPDLASDTAADLDKVADLFITCLAPDRMRPEQRSRKGYFADGDLEGVAGRIYDALAEPELAGTAAVGGASTEAKATATVRTATLMSNALEAAAADCFDAGWDGRGRERLSSAARDHHSVRRRFLEFRPTRDVGARWTIRGWHAAAPRAREWPSRQRLFASAGVMRQAGAQLAELWRGEGARAGRGHAAGGRRSGMARYLIPLIAFLLAFGLALLVLGLTTPTPASPATSAPPTQAAAGSLTKITSLDITGLNYDAVQRNTAVATIDVAASGTAPLSVTVTFTGLIQGGGNKTDHFALSGNTRYVVSDTADVLQYCAFNTRLVTAQVSVTAAADSAPQALATASGDLFSHQCS